VFLCGLKKTTAKNAADRRPIRLRGIKYQEGFRRQLGKSAEWEAAVQRAEERLNAGSWALSPTPPMIQHNKSFCAAFFKKRLLSS
jgi:hypothetical protein